jgi:Stage II sporulation protein E (SpoIIE)
VSALAYDRDRDHDHGCAVVSLAARADIADGARFRQLLKLPEAQGPGRIIVDLSRLSSIDWWAVSGLGAAVIMGRMRSALRAYALQSADPADVLRELDRKIRYFEPGDVMATVSYAMLDPHSRQLHISLAGHLPPVIAAPGQRGVAAEIPSTCRSTSPTALPGRSSRWLLCPVPCCACSPTGWWNAGTSRSMTASPGSARP